MACLTDGPLLRAARTPERGCCQLGSQVVPVPNIFAHLEEKQVLKGVLTKMAHYINSDFTVFNLALTTLNTSPGPRERWVPIACFNFNLKQTQPMSGLLYYPHKAMPHMRAAASSLVSLLPSSPPLAFFHYRSHSGSFKTQVLEILGHCCNHKSYARAKADRQGEVYCRRVCL